MIIEKAFKKKGGKNLLRNCIVSHVALGLNTYSSKSGNYKVWKYHLRRQISQRILSDAFGNIRLLYLQDTHEQTFKEKLILSVYPLCHSYRVDYIPPQIVIHLGRKNAQYPDKIVRYLNTHTHIYRGVNFVI